MILSILFIINVLSQIHGSPSSGPDLPEHPPLLTLPPGLVSTTEYPLCAERSSCLSRQITGNAGSGFNYSKKNCFCDPLCKVYGDCCNDADYFLNDTPEELDLDPLPPDTFSCSRLYGIDSSHTFNIIDKCPQYWSDPEIASKCHMEGPYDPMLSWPVSDTIYGLLYRNIYCSLCHGLSIKDVLYWKGHFKCDALEGSNITVKTLIEEGTFLDYCSPVYKPPAADINFRECKEFTSSCHPDFEDQDIKDKCENPDGSIVSLVYSLNESFKNKYCALCNYGDIFSCTMSQRIFLGDAYAPAFFPISIVLDLNNGIGEGSVSNRVGQVVVTSNKTTETLKLCHEDEVYDPFIAQCRQIGCGSGFQFQNGRCMPIMQGDVQYGNQDNDCIKLIINSTEYTILPNGNIFINNTQEFLTKDEYEYGVDNTVLICTNFTRNYTETSIGPVMGFKFDQAQTILSTLGLIISLIALAIHLIVYCILPQLRNLAGKNLMCLVASLFIAQFLFLFGVARTKYYGLCFTLAIIMHYAFLAAFCWMNVMSVDIFRTFSVKIQPSSTNKHRRDFIRYSLYAWLTPFVIVTIAVVLDFTSMHSVLWPGYGYGVCWISSRWALLTFFGIPAFIIIAANTILFSLTTASICHITKQAKIASKASDKFRFLLYIKLSTIMGLTWIFGFIATFADAPVLWYIFIIFNSLQGAFICITFVCNRKTIRMLKEKYGKVITSKRPSTDTTRLTLLSHSKSRSHSVETDNTVKVNQSV